MVVRPSVWRSPCNLQSVNSEDLEGYSTTDHRSMNQLIRALGSSVLGPWPYVNVRLARRCATVASRYGCRDVRV